jgi:pyruvate dehydrogenase E2 component (dihydrolipoamide acetyltransferase)
MPIPITMPRLSDTMEEGALVKWHVKVGDAVAAGDHLADVETDKATMELQAFDDGKVARIAVEEGQSTKVGGLILVLAQNGESIEDAAKAAIPSGTPDSAPQTEESAAQPDEAQAPAPASASSASSETGRLRVSPLARKMAEDAGVDLANLQGSGPDGRIIKRDILAAQTGKPVRQPPASKSTAAPSSALAAAPLANASVGESQTIPVTSMRKTIAKRLLESKTTIPHFTVTVSVNMDPLLELRAAINAQLEATSGGGGGGGKLSVNDFIVRAVAVALRAHPIVNASWTGDAITQHGQINLGIAVALPQERGGGLVVPVLRNVPALSLRAIAGETRRLAQKAREQGLSADDMNGGTFTISNLGMFGVDHFEAIINPPQAAILAVGAALQKPVVRKGELTLGHEMTLTLSADHRVIDGSIAAAFLATLKQTLESPAAMLV